MKRIILVLVLALVLLLAGCGSDNAHSKDANDNSAVTEEDNGSKADTKTTEESSTPNTEHSQDIVASDSKVDVDITEKMFVSYINDIYTNTADYVGNTIRLEGMFKAYYDEQTGKTYYLAYRTGPGCCGNDGATCGFEFAWSGDIPDDNDWIEVVGKLRTYEENGNTYLVLDGISVKVLDYRGAETVYQ